MKFEEILPALIEGKKVRRKNKIWQNNYGFLFISEKDDTIFSDNPINWFYKITKEDLLVNDWEVVEEPKKVKLRDLTEEQYQKWFNANCCSKNEDKKMSDCFDCVFHNVVCNLEVSRCWTKHKDLYSDKFLDQEIEIYDE